MKTSGAVRHTACARWNTLRVRILQQPGRGSGQLGPMDQIGLGARMRTGRVAKAWRMKRSCLICGERLQKRGAFRRGASAPGLLENAACLNAGNRKCFYKICRKFAADNQTPSGTACMTSRVRPAHRTENVTGAEKHTPCACPVCWKNVACLNAESRKCFLKIYRKFAAGNQTPSGTYDKSCILTFANRE